MAKEPTPPPISTAKPAPPPAPPPKKMSKHTPGPWRVNGYGEIVCGEGNDELRIADVAPWDPRKHREEMSANGRLLAAAPEMLAALKNLENDHPDDPWFRSMPRTAWNMVQSAIAKAEGRE